MIIFNGTSLKQIKEIFLEGESLTLMFHPKSDVVQGFCFPGEKQWTRQWSFVATPNTSNSVVASNFFSLWNDDVIFFVRRKYYIKFQSFLTLTKAVGLFNITSLSCWKVISRWILPIFFVIEPNMQKMFTVNLKPENNWQQGHKIYPTPGFHPYYAALSPWTPAFMFW